MAQSISPHWICKQDTTTFSWMSHQYPKQHSPHHSGSMNTSKYLLDLQSTSIVPGTYDRCLKGFSFTITYLYDIIIFSRTAEEHLVHIRQVFRKLWNVQLSMKPSKCHFLAKEIQYLGDILSTTGIRLLP